MFLGEERLKKHIKTGALILFMLLLSTKFDQETVIIVLLSLIYMKMRD
jgi:hypothetical protein